MSTNYQKQSQDKAFTDLIFDFRLCFFRETCPYFVVEKIFSHDGFAKGNDALSIETMLQACSAHASREHLLGNSKLYKLSSKGGKVIQLFNSNALKQLTSSSRAGSDKVPALEHFSTISSLSSFTWACLARRASNSLVCKRAISNCRSTILAFNSSTA